MDLVFATMNDGKVKELEDLLRDLPVKITCLKDYPSVPEIVEDGKTYRDNAGKKALEVARFTGKMAIADDSGIEIDALNGFPGVQSARFLGEDASPEERNLHILKKLQGIPEKGRGAQFRCVIAVCLRDGRCYFAEDTSKGLILAEPKGISGFGYDPIFFDPSLKKTYAELTVKEKNEVSHRGKALRKAREIIVRLLRKSGELNPDE